MLAIAPEVAAAVRRDLRARALPVRGRRRRDRGARSCSVIDRRQPTASTPVDMPMDVLLGKPPKMHRDVQRVGSTLRAARPDRRRRWRTSPFDVLRHPTVAEQALPDHHRRPHRRRPDRAATRWSARGRCRSPTARSRSPTSRASPARRWRWASARRSPSIDAPASGRMAVGEAITNLLAAPIERSTASSCQRNWMAACGEPGPRTRALYDTVQGGRHGAVPGARHQRSGRQGLACRCARSWQDDDGAAKQVTSPVSLDRLRVRDASTTCAAHSTPQLRATGDTDADR